MAKILIRDESEGNWEPVIEAKLSVMLGSMLAHISRIDIEFSQIPGYRGGRSTYVCKLEVSERNGESYLLYSYQPDANLAIEGAIARARRAITRLSRARVSAWGQVSVQ